MQVNYSFFLKTINVTLTWLLMLETASLQPSSSVLVLLKVSVFPLVSSEVFLASAGLQEADTLVLIK